MEGPGVVAISIGNYPDGCDIAPDEYTFYSNVNPSRPHPRIAEAEELGNGGRVPWVSGRPGDARVYAGTDFIIALDGRIAAICLFFDQMAEPGPR